jgi:hypothetical protein
MELRDIVLQLWRLRLAVSVGVVLAAVAALSVGYALRLSPLTVEKRGATFGAARTSLQVDTRRDSLVDPEPKTTALLARTETLARVVGSRPIVAAAAAGVGAPVGALTIEGPYPNEPGRQSSEPSAQQRANAVLGESAAYRVLVDTEPTAPVITLFVQAPTGGEALRLGNAVAAALRAYVARRTGDAIPEERAALRDSLDTAQRRERRTISSAERRARERTLMASTTVVRPLGSSIGGTVRDRSGILVVVATFAALVLAWCVALVLAAAAVRFLRSR